MWKKSTLADVIFIFLIILAVSCGSPENRTDGRSSDAASPPPATELEVLSYRFYESDQALFDQFTELTGIPVRVTRAPDDSLQYFLDTNRTDVVIAGSVSALNPLRESGVLEVFSTPVLEDRIANYLYKDKEGYWFGLTRKAVAFVYNREEVEPSSLGDYFSLSAAAFRGQVLAAGHSGSPAQLIVSAMLAEGKEEAAGRWAAGVGANRRKDGPSTDFEIIKAIAAGEAKVGVIYAPSHIQLHMSGDPEFFKTGEATGVVFPKNDDGATYIDLSCAGITRSTNQRGEALRLLEFLAGEGPQASFAGALHEYPANVMVLPSDFAINLGGYREAKAEPGRVAARYPAALEILKNNGWD